MYKNTKYKYIILLLCYSVFFGANIHFKTGKLNCIMVKSLVPPHPSRAELRACIEEARKEGIGAKEALVYAMKKLNRKYNRRVRHSHVEAGKTWKKPAGFDYEWWSGSLLHVRLGVKPTKQEAKREREKRARFMAMVKRAEKRMDVFLGRGAHQTASAPSSVYRKPIYRKLVFPDPLNKEDVRLEALFLEATDEAAVLLDKVVEPSGKTLLETLVSKTPGESVGDFLTLAWDLPTSCAQSDKCSPVILSAKNV